MIEGANVTLRLFTDEDFDEYLALDNAYAEQGEFLEPALHSTMARRKDFEESKGWWDEHKGCLAIAAKDGKLLGLVGFSRRNPAEAGYEVGYVIARRKDRGKGYGTEALRIFSAYLFELKPIAKLHLQTAENNVAARRIAEKCGYEHEGTFRKHWFVRGEYVNGVQYGLLREDCPSLSDVLSS